MKQTNSLSSIICALIAFAFSSCDPTVTEAPLLPVLITSAVTAITQTTASSGGVIASDGGSTITARGVCWATTPNPTVASSHTTDGAGIGTFTSAIKGLTASTAYYARAYATNANGTAYGSAYQITTLVASTVNTAVFNPNLTYGTMTDQDGNTYRTIAIGNQTWMAENLRVTKYRNGDPIPNVTDITTWYALTTGAQCTYSNTIVADSISKYGLLYNFYAVSDSRNIAPTGWHVPTNAEWNTLEIYVTAHVGSSLSTAKALASSLYWNFYTSTGTIGTNPSLNNSTGFSAVPGGCRSEYSRFYLASYYGNWWTATESNATDAWFGSLRYDQSDMWGLLTNLWDGLSVRCLRDN